MIDPAVEAAQRVVNGYSNSVTDKIALALINDAAAAGAREALNWAAGVIEQEAREQWNKDRVGMPFAQIVAQRMDIVARVIRSQGE